MAGRYHAVSDTAAIATLRRYIGAAQPIPSNTELARVWRCTAQTAGTTLARLHAAGLLRERCGNASQFSYSLDGVAWSPFGRRSAVAVTTRGVALRAALAERTPQ